MAVPFASLIPQRSRVLPQGGAVLGQLTGSFQRGLEQGRLRAAEDEAPGLIMDYLDAQAAGYQPALGSLIAASGYAGGGQAAQYNGAPTRENAATQTALTPGSPTFDGRFALRRENAGQQNAPLPSGVDAGVRLLDQFEGFRATPYEDWSYRPGTGERYMSGMRIGYGQDATGMPATVTQDQAQQALRQQIEQQYIPSIVNTIGADRWSALDANQQGVLISLVHNYGSLPGRIVDELMAGDPAATSAAIAALGGDNSGINQGRRQAEAAAFSGSGLPAGGAATAATGSSYGAPSQPAAWSPPTGQERALLRAMIINPVTREMGIQLATQRMMPPQPQQPDFGFTEVNGVLYATDPRTGQAVPVAGGAAAGPQWVPITDPTTGWTGRQNTQTGDVEWNPQGMQPQAPDAGEPPTDIQIYDYYVQQETAAGRTPKSFNDWDLERRGRLGGIDPTVAEQRYALLYQNAARELPILEQTWASLGDLGNQAADQLPRLIGNWIVSPNYQRAVSAMTQVVQMQTYALTGAAATESEARRIAITLLPAIGDGPEVIADKFQRTRDAIDFIRGAAGPAGASAAPPAAASPSLVVTPPGAGGPPPTLFYDPTTGTLVPMTP